MTQEERQNLINTLIIDNNTMQVSPKKMREVLLALNESISTTDVSAVSAITPLNYDAFTNVLSIQEVTALQDGFLSKENFNSFNNKLSGTVSVNRIPKSNGSGVLSDSVLIQVGGNLGLGSAVVPGELFHIGDGNILLEGGGEVAQKFKRDFNTTGENLGVPTGSGISVNPIFQIGRIIQAGDGDPEIRIMYSDDNTVERTVFEVDRKGIAASVKTAIGSHFEGFASLTDVNPMFRLNSYPRMRLEMGAGGNNITDVAVERDASGGLAFFTNSTSRGGFDSSGNLGIGTSLQTAQLHLANHTVNQGINWETVSGGNQSIQIQGTLDASTATTDVAGGLMAWGASGTNANVSGLMLQLKPGTVGNKTIRVIDAQNYLAGASTLSLLDASGTVGGMFESQGASTGDNIGIYNIAGFAHGRNIAGFFRAMQDGDGYYSTHQIGIMSIAGRNSALSGYHIGGYFGLQNWSDSRNGLNTNSALIADNGDMPYSIFTGKRNAIDVFNFTQYGELNITPNVTNSTPLKINTLTGQSTNIFEYNLNGIRKVQIDQVGDIDLAGRLRFYEGGDPTKIVQALYVESGSALTVVRAGATSNKIALKDSSANSFIIFDALNKSFALGATFVGLSAPSSGIAIEGKTLLGTTTNNGIDQLQVNGTVNLTTPTTSAGGYDILTRNTTSGQVEKIASGGLGIWTQTGNDIANSNSGNVGIGTVTPPTGNARLVIKGQGSSNTTFSIVGYNSGGGNIYTIDDQGNFLNTTGITSSREFISARGYRVDNNVGFYSTIFPYGGYFLKDTGGFWKSDLILKYATDLSGSYDARSLVDKGYVDSKRIQRLAQYTVATLPTGVQGDTAYVTDALAPTYMTTIVGGGAVVTPVFYNGTTWVAN